MKKYFLFSSIIIISLSFGLFIFLDVKVNIELYKNSNILGLIGNIFEKSEVVIADVNEVLLPKFEIDGTDYIGIVGIKENNLIFPVKDNCEKSIINVDSACKYYNDNFVILGTSLKNSFIDYRSYKIDDVVTFTNILGYTYQYKINDIKRLSLLQFRYSADLIVVIKDYYNLEYVLFICGLF